MLKQCKSIGYRLNLRLHTQCSILKIQSNPFSDWKYDKEEEYFPSIKKSKSKSGPKIILDSDEHKFESPYIKIKKQKNPSFSYQSQPQNQDIFSSLQPLIKHTKDTHDDDEKIESESESDSNSNSIIAEKQHQNYQVTKYNEWKAKQIETKEFIPRSDHYKPRTLQDFKNWNIKQDEILKYKEKQHRNITEEETLRSYDLLRSGHIIKALQPPNTTHSNSDGINQYNTNSDDTLALSTKHKFDFHGDATYVIEGVKYFEYYVAKYAYFFTFGLVKISILSSVSLYLLLYQNYVSQNELIDLLQAMQPFNASTISIAKSDHLSDILYNALVGSCVLPIIITSGIYAKCKGEWWEYKALKKNPKENVNLKTDVLTLQNKGNVSGSKIIYEIALIRERRKERKNALAPLYDVVDISETFSPHRKSGLSSGGGMPFTPKKMAEKGMKMNKFIKKHGVSNGIALWMSTSFSATDPRRAGSTQNFGLLKLQTRLDEFGRVIPGWQRQNTKLWIMPTVAIFLFFPCFGDWLLAWTA